VTALAAWPYAQRSAEINGHTMANVDRLGFTDEQDHRFDQTAPLRGADAAWLPVLERADRLLRGLQARFVAGSGCSTTAHVTGSTSAISPASRWRELDGEVLLDGTWSAAARASRPAAHRPATPSA